MKNNKNRNLRRGVGMLIRLTKWEKQRICTMAKRYGLNQVQYSRCKLLDIPFEHLNGRMDNSHLEPEAATKATV